MPIGWIYRCTSCSHQWLLYSTRLHLGPVQWGCVTYTCFSCQTFLELVQRVDRNAWLIWLRNNKKAVEAHPGLAEMAARIGVLLGNVTGITPVELNFEPITCLTCKDDQMKTVPFGDHLMRCPRCRGYMGERVDDGSITIYRTEYDADP